MSFFCRNCHSCAHKITLKQRMPLSRSQTITWLKCQVKLDTNHNISLVHSFIIGCISGYSISYLTELPFIWASSVGMFVMYFMQPFIDLFFSLEETEEEL